MDKTALVSSDLERGFEVLRALDKADLKLSVALWAYLPQYEDWRLVISARKLDGLDVRDAYGLVNESFNASGLPIEHTPSVVILPNNDPFVKDLRRMFAKTRSVEGMRLGGRTIGGRFLEDAYIYRIV